jgi:putative ABC transport system ATP-binding protein
MFGDHAESGIAHGTEATMTSAIVAHNVSKSYRRGSQKVQVLSGLNLEVQSAEFLALMGPSGSGKTTLLNLIGGLDAPDAGELQVAGQRIDRLTERQLSKWRARHVGFVFQSYNLMPLLSAERNVELPLLLTSMGKTRRMQSVRAALDLVGLAERRSHRPSELSGGQQQRVAIARALVADPDLLVCDEPTGDLDRKTADEVLELLRLISRSRGKTIVMVTHDPKAAAFADRVVQMDKGQLVMDTAESHVRSHGSTEGHGVSAQVENGRVGLPSQNCNHT